MENEKALMLGTAQTRFRKKFKKRQRIRKFFGGLLWVLLMLVFLFSIFMCIFRFSVSDTEGMPAKVPQGSVYVVNRLAFTIREPERGETAAVQYGDTVKCLRVVGLPGDNIDIQDGSVFINGKKAVEGYANGETYASVSHLTVAADEYFMLNDDRSNAQDSRTSEIKKEDVIGSEILSFQIPDYFRSETMCQNVLSAVKETAEWTDYVISLIGG